MCTKGLKVALENQKKIKNDIIKQQMKIICSL